MAEEVSKTSEKYEKSKTGTDILNLCVDTTKTTSYPSSSSTPTSPIGLRKSASIKRYNCLCSPTTHAGSFRCRHHRNSEGPIRSSMSVGSKLSELADKPTVMCQNVSHMPFVNAHGQGSPSSAYQPA